MPRDVHVLGVYMPSLTLLFLVCALLGWGLDRWLAWLGVYRHAWHPTLLRVSLFICLYGALALCIYR